MFREALLEGSKTVEVEMACPNCFKGNIVKVAKDFGVSVTKIDKGEKDTLVKGKQADVITILKKMGVNKKDLQVYINYWNK